MSRLNLEQLDARCLPSISLTNGVLTVSGNTVLIQKNCNFPDACTVYNFDDSGYHTAVFNVVDIHSIRSTLNGNGYYANNLINGQNTNGVFTESITCGDGNDQVYLGACNLAGMNNYVYGGGGNDTLESNGWHGGINYIDGGSGNNTIVCDVGVDYIRNAQTVYNFNPAEDVYF